MFSQVTQEDMRRMEQACKRMIAEDKKTAWQEKQAAGRAFDGPLPGARFINRVRAVIGRNR